MKTIYNFIALAAISFAFGANAGKFTLPEYQTITLKNGLTLALMEQHEVPLINVDVRVKSGAINSKTLGLAEVTAEALMFGSDKLSKTEIEQQVDFIGANLATWSGKEQSGVSASFLAKDQQTMLPLINSVLRKPQFNQDDLAKYLPRYASQIEQQSESPKQVIGDYFNRLIYGNSPYAMQTSATKDSLKAINQAAIKAYYQQNYQPANTVVAVVGDFDSKQMQQQLTELFGSWQNTEQVAANNIKQIAANNKAQVMLVDKNDAIETTFRIGSKGISRNNPDYVAVTVVNTILGGRFTSWLNTELRTNSGLSYGARSTFNAYKNDGSFYMSSFTKVDTTEQALDLALTTYQRLWHQGIDDKTLASAKAYIKGQFPPDYESPAQLANLLADMMVFNIDKSFINNFSENVDALTVAKAKTIINQYFPKDNLQFVLVGKADAIRDIAKKYGEVTETSIN